MCKKIFEAIFFIVIVIILPLLLRPEKLMAWEVFFVILAGLVLYFSQPNLAMEKAVAKNSKDQKSALFILISFLLVFLIPIIDFGYFNNNDSYIYIKMIGALFVIAGLSFRYWAIRTLGKFFTSMVVIQDEHLLIQNGPYKIVRHPSYTGAWLMGVGVSLILASFVGVAVSTILLTITYNFRIRIEEEALLSKLGSSYEEYQKKTWKLFPFIH